MQIMQRFWGLSISGRNCFGGSSKNGFVIEAEMEIIVSVSAANFKLGLSNRLRHSTMGPDRAGEITVARTIG